MAGCPCPWGAGRRCLTVGEDRRSGLYGLRPFFINIILREFIFSYIILVNINKHDDVSACVSIIINLAHRPNFELDISPIIINLMCLTDE